MIKKIIPLIETNNIEKKLYIIDIKISVTTIFENMKLMSRLFY